MEKLTLVLAFLTCGLLSKSTISSQISIYEMHQN